MRCPQKIFHTEIKKKLPFFGLNKFIFFFSEMTAIGEFSTQLKSKGKSWELASGTALESIPLSTLQCQMKLVNVCKQNAYRLMIINFGSRS